jgi:hypothetical protein
MRWMLKSLLFVALAGLPLWVALFMAATHLPGNYHEREEFAYAVIFGGVAVAVACVISTLLTSLGFVVYHVASGGRARKALLAIFWTLAGCGVVAGGLVAVKSGVQHKVAKKAVARQDMETRVLEFVRADGATRRFAGGTPTYAVLGTYREHDGRRIEYTVRVEGTAKFNAAVDVDYATDPPTLRLACVTPMDQSFMDVRDDRCARADAMMRALDFARAHPQPRAAVGGEPVYALVGEVRRPEGGFEYHVDVQGATQAWAIVRTDPSGAGLVLACVTTAGRSMAGFRSDPCATPAPGAAPLE